MARLILILRGALRPHAFTETYKCLKVGNLPRYSFYTVRERNVWLIIVLLRSEQGETHLYLMYAPFLNIRRK